MRQRFHRGRGHLHFGGLGTGGVLLGVGIDKGLQVYTLDENAGLKLSNDCRESFGCVLPRALR
jgi:hypothetical protein